jgi:hypothetical protein
MAPAAAWVATPQNPKASNIRLYRGAKNDQDGGGDEGAMRLLVIAPTAMHAIRLSVPSSRKPTVDLSRFGEDPYNERRLG